jgi:solute carrier family 25 carnitine/acylcarnitine transporter 20/29
MDDTLRTLAAGTCGGMASILIVHPLDTVRTRLQAATAQKYRGAWHCASSTVRAEGARALYKGLAWPLAAQGVYKAIMFGVYGFMSRSLRGDDPRRPLAAYEVFAAGGLAGGANALILAPVELIRNRLQVASHAVTLREVLPQGVRGMYRGLGATLLRDAPGVGAYYAAFELMRRRAVALRGAPKLSLGELAVAGAFGGVAFWTVALPLARRGVSFKRRRRGVYSPGKRTGLREDAPAGRRRGLFVRRGRPRERGARGRAPAHIRRLRVRARAGRARRGGRV